MRVSNINSTFSKLNTRRNAGRGRGKAAVGGNKVPPGAPAVEMEMLVNPAGLTDGQVRIDLVQMSQAITLQGQAMTAQIEQQGVPRQNPPSSTIVSRLRYFTRRNPPIYTRSKIDENI